MIYYKDRVGVGRIICQLFLYSFILLPNSLNNIISNGKFYHR